MNIRIFSFAIISLFLLSACNSEMLSDAQNSMQDPRVAEINVKQGQIDIPNNGTYSFDLANGVKVDETSEPVLFTIENPGTADLELTGIALSGENPDEFAISGELQESFLSAGANTSFSLTFSPSDTSAKDAVVTITTNDFDEAEYSFTITSQSRPVPNFNARLRNSFIPMTVNFQDRSLPSDGITSWEWDFDGDGVVDSTEQNPTYTYNDAGNYTVLLKVTGAGGENIKYTPNYITASQVEPVIIKDNLSGTKSLCSAYIDNDDFIDVVGSSSTNGIIYWFENDGTPENGGWIQHEVSTLAGVMSVKVAYIDNDSYIDIVSSDGTTLNYDIVWWKNDGTPLDGGWTPTTVASSVRYNRLDFADMDNDNDIDIVNATTVAYQFAWWENVGTPGDGSSWTSHIIYTPIAAEFRDPTNFYAVDLNGDTYPDITSMCHIYTEWWQNNGTGTFGAINSIFQDTTYTGNKSYHYGDLNNDSRIDLITGPISSGSDILWYKNNGEPSPTFTSSAIISDYAYLSSILMSDINNDGYQDILTSSNTGSLEWWRNNGDIDLPSFTMNTIIDTSSFSAGRSSVDDFDNDNIKEIICPATSINNGGNFSYFDVIKDFDITTFDIEFLRVTFATAGDIDGDGICEPIAVAASGPGGVKRLAWWDKASSGSITRHEIKTDFISSDVKAFDFNIDGYCDIVASDGNLHLFINDGSPADDTGGNCNSWTETELGSGTEFEFQDIDNDSDMDIIVSDGSGTFWYENTDGYGAFTVHNDPYIDETSQFISSINSADINGDGTIDFVAADSNDNDILWFQKDANSESWTRYDIDTDFSVPYMASAADIDSDGDIDVAACSYSGNEIAWWENDGTPEDGGWGKHTITTLNAPRTVYCVDINGDGKSDILASSTTDNKIVWIKNNGGTDKPKIFSRQIDGTTDIRIIQSNLVQAQSAVPVDLDFDGDYDIVGAVTKSLVDYGYIMTWENNMVDYGL